ncbi:MAG: hypothetical protein AB7H88_13270 [Vicinamibacterales bacterium]
MRTVLPRRLAGGLVVMLLLGATRIADAQTPDTAPTAGAPDDTATSSPQAPSDPDQQARDVEELKRQIQVLAAEVEQMRSGEETTSTLSVDEQRRLGLAPAAAAAYRKASGVSIAGYGEMLYENVDGRTPRIDFLRAILYAGYRFDDRFIFNSEIEVEHADEISVEFAYLDYRLRDDLTIRGGMLLVPLGLVNEFHEPTVFVGARRPETEQRIIPSTWRENGVGILGGRGWVNYRLFAVNGLKATGFSAAGLRGGRQKGAQALAANWGLAGRLDVTPVPGVFGGVGLYRGGSGQDLVDSGRADVATTIMEFHGQAQVRGFDVRGLFARATLDDVTALNRALGLSGARSVGETLEGGYVQVGYNVLSQVAPRTSLMPFYRFEQINTQSSVPTGFLADPAQDQTFHTFGVELKPIGQIVVKADYQRVTNRAGTGRNQFNVNLGYVF